VQVAAAELWRLNPTDDSLETKARVLEDDFDWLHAFGDSPAHRSAATDKLG